MGGSSAGGINFKGLSNSALPARSSAEDAAVEAFQTELGGLLGDLPMFVRNLQLNGRLLPPCDLHPLSARRPEDRQLFATFVVKLEKAIVERGILPQLSTLAADDMLPGLFEVSDGVIGRVCRLFEAALVHALRRGAHKLERVDISWATERWGMEQAFIDRNPFAGKAYG